VGNPLTSNAEALEVRSAELYRCALIARREEPLADQTKRAIDLLIQSLGAALKLRDRVSATEIPFTRTLLETVPDDDWPLFLNEYGLGLGNPSGPIVVMGTEHAYNLAEFKGEKERSDALESLALESCGSAILWLANAGIDLAQHLAANRWEACQIERRARPYQRHPWDVSRVPGGHTWNILSQIVAPWSFNEGTLGLGDLTYQIERSAFPRNKIPTNFRLLSAWAFC